MLRKQGVMWDGEKAKPEKADVRIQGSKEVSGAKDRFSERPSFGLSRRSGQLTR